jgi:hypothetical protein
MNTAKIDPVDWAARCKTSFTLSNIDLLVSHKKHKLYNRNMQRITNIDLAATDQ